MFDRFVPHIVCDLIILSSETFHAYPVSGNKDTFAWTRLLFPSSGAIAPQANVPLSVC